MKKNAWCQLVTRIKLLTNRHMKTGNCLFKGSFKYINILIALINSKNNKIFKSFINSFRKNCHFFNFIYFHFVEMFVNWNIKLWSGSDDSCGIVWTKVFAEEMSELISSYLFHLLIGHKCQKRVGINHGRFLHRLVSDQKLTQGVWALGNEQLVHKVCVCSTVSQTSAKRKSLFNVDDDYCKCTQLLCLQCKCKMEENPLI